MRWRVPRPRFRTATLMVLVGAIALGLVAWRFYYSPRWVWRRAVHGKDSAASGAAWQQLSKGQIAGMTREETEAMLAEALADSHFPVRFGAVAAIRFSGRDLALAITHLTGRLEDEDFRVRRAVVSAIGEKVKVGVDRELAEPPLRSALDDREAEVRRQAVDSLGTVAGKLRRPDDPLIPLIASKLEDPDENVRVQAGFELARLGGGDEALPMLKAFADEHLGKSEDAETGASVERALFAIGKIAERSDDALDFLIGDIYRKGEPLENAAFAALQLTALTDPKGRDRAIGRLREALKGDDFNRRVGAALVLESLGRGAEAVPTWIEALRSPDDRDLRFHAIIALRNLRPVDPRAIPALREAAKDPDLEIQQRAAEGVAVLEKAASRPAPTP